MNVYKITAQVITKVETDRYGNEDEQTKTINFYMDAESEYTALLGAINYLGENGDAKGVLKGLAVGELKDTVIL